MHSLKDDPDIIIKGTDIKGLSLKDSVVVVVVVVVWHRRLFEGGIETSWG